MQSVIFSNRRSLISKIQTRVYLNILFIILKQQSKKVLAANAEVIKNLHLHSCDYLNTCVIKITMQVRLYVQIQIAV